MLNRARLGRSVRKMVLAIGAATATQFLSRGGVQSQALWLEDEGPSGAMDVGGRNSRNKKRRRVIRSGSRVGGCGFGVLRELRILWTIHLKALVRHA